MGKVLGEASPAPVKNTRAHPAVNLRQQLQSLSKKRGRPQSTVAHYFSGDALRQPPFEKAHAFVGWPGENQISVGVQVDESRGNHLTPGVDDVVGR